MPESSSIGSLSTLHSLLTQLSVPLEILANTHFILETNVEGNELLMHVVGTQRQALTDIMEAVKAAKAWR